MSSEIQTIWKGTTLISQSTPKSTQAKVQLIIMLLLGKSSCLHSVYSVRASSASSKATSFLDKLKKALTTRQINELINIWTRIVLTV